MVKLRYRTNKHLDNRTWWTCPSCKIYSCYFVIQPIECEHCGHELPLFDLMKKERMARIVFHHTGTDNMWR